MVEIHQRRQTHYEIENLSRNRRTYCEAEKRVNMRFRDASFDIDWDLKWEKGNCLNTLDEIRFEVCKRALINPPSSGPKAVKRVHEIFDKPTFLGDKISPSDVRQGSLGDCWLMSSLTALANTKDGIQRICVEWDTNGEWIISIIDDKLFLKSPDWDSPSVHRHLLEQTDREDGLSHYSLLIVKIQIRHGFLFSKRLMLKETEVDEDEPEPWNAVCIVGFRVYSKDEGLVLNICEEGMEEEENELKEENEAGIDGDVEDTEDDKNTDKTGRNGKDGKLKYAARRDDSIPSDVATKIEPDKDSNITISGSHKVVTGTSSSVNNDAKDTPTEKQPQVATKNLEIEKDGDTQQKSALAISEATKDDIVKEPDSQCDIATSSDSLTRTQFSLIYVHVTFSVQFVLRISPQ
ncbi:hypothetical protein BHYA_0102g00150 [Botrytis hyacinthi]|uniref:Calpain catalytic domain-containing protein n=1 Tax=Botrytis hyacinthi TaxID=278943 RepID=A0A4Z1GP92_9HELO|nr:hypothetical protein BHYA_0102g00150 [Botrytis hyacinthi]